MKQHKDCNFSYAGLKTQVRLAIESRNMYVQNIKYLLFLVVQTASQFIHHCSFPFILLICVDTLCSNANIPIYSASNQDRRSRADIAASFQVTFTFG